MDTSAPVARDEFLKALWELIDPKDLKWVFMTHEDGEHGGNVEAVLNAAPNARLITNFIGMSKLMAEFEVPMHRVYLLNIGQGLNVGDRILTALRPPIFDSSATAGLYDGKTGAFFSVDSFGAFIPAPTQDATDIPQADFTRGFNIWNQANHPWVALADHAKFEGVLESLRKVGPKSILSSHLPPATGRTEQLLKALAAIPSVEPFVGPDQAALQAMMAGMGGPPPA